MEEYKGFLIDTDTSDHSVTIESVEHKIIAVFGLRSLAIKYIDGFTDAINKLNLINS
jgi:hypothetical protein